MSGAGSNTHAQIDTHISSNGSDHTYIDQDVTSGSAPTFTADNFSVNSTCLTISGGTYNGSYCNSSATALTIYIPPGLPEVLEVTINTTAIPVITSMNLDGYCRGVNNIDSNNVTYYSGSGSGASGYYATLSAYKVELQTGNHSRITIKMDNHSTNTLTLSGYIYIELDTRLD